MGRLVRRVSLPRINDMNGEIVSRGGVGARGTRGGLGACDNGRRLGFKGLGGDVEARGVGNSLGTRAPGVGFRFSRRHG